MSKFAHENDLLIIETSAKENINVEETFKMIACSVCDLIPFINLPSLPGSSVVKLKSQASIGDQTDHLKLHQLD